MECQKKTNGNEGFPKLGVDFKGGTYIKVSSIWGNDHIGNGTIGCLWPALGSCSTRNTGKTWELIEIMGGFYQKSTSILLVGPSLSRSSLQVSIPG